MTPTACRLRRLRENRAIDKKRGGPPEPKDPIFEDLTVPPVKKASIASNLKAVPKIYDLAKKLIPFRTSIESLGLDYTKYSAWFIRSPARVKELKMIRATALIALQEGMIRGEKGWQSQFRLIESLEPELWIKQSSTVGRKKDDLSPYAASFRKH